MLNLLTSFFSSCSRTLTCSSGFSRDFWVESTQDSSCLMPWATSTHSSRTVDWSSCRFLSCSATDFNLAVLSSSVLSTFVSSRTSAMSCILLRAESKDCSWSSKSWNNHLQVKSSNRTFELGFDKLECFAAGLRDRRNLIWQERQPIGSLQCGTTERWFHWDFRIRSSTCSCCLKIRPKFVHIQRTAEWNLKILSWNTKNDFYIHRFRGLQKSQLQTFLKTLVKKSD